MRRGKPLAGDPLAASLALLQAGKIVALKGLGGFHLACDARNAEAVAELRRRKQREAKPFAVMGLNPAALAAYAQVGTAELDLLRSPAAPIVLCPKAADELPGIAPGLAWLGVMLPSTPLHLLLWHEAAGRPAGTAWLDEPAEMLLVMTSANPHGEPLVIDNAEAVERLAGIADAFLVHDREIVIRCDDSVLRAGPHGASFIRRARGYAPLPIRLADSGPTVLALGGYLKNTICVIKGGEAYLSQHVGSLDNVAAIGFLEETVRHLLAILDVRPELIAHDLHPDFASTRLALALADEFAVPAVAVGHHQAHLAAICAEHAVNEPLIGLALDGVGLGEDGALWGGELLHLDGSDLSSVWGISSRFVCRVATVPPASRGGWRFLSCTARGWLNVFLPGWGAVIRGATPGPCCSCSTVNCAARQRPVSGAASMLPRPCSAYALKCATKDRRRWSLRGWQRIMARSTPCRRAF